MWTLSISSPAQMRSDLRVFYEEGAGGRSLRVSRSAGTYEARAEPRDPSREALTHAQADRSCRQCLPVPELEREPRHPVLCSENGRSACVVPERAAKSLPSRSVVR